MCEFLIAVIVACIIAFILCRTQFGSDLIEGFLQGPWKTGQKYSKKFRKDTDPNEIFDHQKKIEI